MISFSVFLYIYKYYGYSDIATVRKGVSIIVYRAFTRVRVYEYSRTLVRGIYVTYYFKRYPYYTVPVLLLF